MKRQTGFYSKGAAALLLLLCCTILTLSSLPTAYAIEATFTPNPADSIENGGDGGPLPVSMAQRKQLLELEAAIVNSQDPQATLQHVAQQNQMSGEELVGMLDRNRKDLQDSGQLDAMVSDVDVAMQAQMAAGGGGGGGRSMANSLPRRIIGLIISIFMGLIKTASVTISRSPKQSTLLAILLTGTFLAVHNAPRNGIAFQPGTPILRGHTTVFEPPMIYLERSCVNSYERGGGWISSLPEPTTAVKSTKKTKSSKSKKQSPIGGIGMTQSLEEVDIVSNAKEGEVTVKTSRKTEGFALITAAQTLITLDQSDDDTDSDEMMECMQESITSIFEERRFSEFIPGDSSSLKFRSFLVASQEDEDEVTEGAVMAMKLLGDFGRFGVQPLCISYETDADGSESLVHCVAFHTLTGGHFDGELRFSVEETEDLDAAISVTLAIPKGGRAPPVRLAESMVSSLTESIAQSSQIRMKQTLSRRQQSMKYRAAASGRAKTKRHQRYEQEKAAEEMAVERKRKWKRNNPDAGSYRPSGRLRSPNAGGGPKFGS